MNTMLKISRSWWMATLLLAACAADVPMSVDEEIVETDDPEEERTERQDLTLSSCGQELLARYKDSPYVPLVRWNTNSTAGAAAPRDFMTTDPRWYGCTGESRNDEYGFGDVYFFKGVVGVIFRPDKPPPPDTVPVYGYESSVRGTGGTTIWPEPRRDRCISTNPLAPTIAGAANARYARWRVEGYAYSWSYRPTTGDGTLAFYQQNKVSTTGSIYDCYNDTSTVVPAGYTVTNMGLNGYVKTEASVTVTPTGECTWDNDCAATQLCYWLEPFHFARKGPRGFCTSRCLTHSECGGDFPYCDIEAQRCGQAGIPFEGPATTFTRSGIASYQVGKSRLAWANANERRYEDRGDGFGPQLLMEYTTQNRVLWTNDVTKISHWSQSSSVRFTATDSPGPHDASMFQRSVGGTLPRVSPMPTGTAGASRHTVSWWSKAFAYTGSYSYVDQVNTAAPITLTTLPSSEWRRLDISAVFDPMISSNVRIQGSAAAVHSDGRLVAYAQIESNAFPTSAIFQESGTSSRARDIMSVNLADLPGGNLSWRMYVWPSFSCADLKNSAVTSQKLLSIMEGVTERTRLTFDVSGTTCNMTLWNSAWTTPNLTITDLSWERHQMLSIHLVSSIIGTGLRVRGSPTGDEGGTPIQTQPLNWASTARLEVAPTFFGRVSPPIWISTDTRNGSGGIYGPPALMDLEVTTTSSQAVITFSSNVHATSFVDWGLSTPSTRVNGPQGTRHSVTIPTLSPFTTYVYRVTLNSIHPGDSFVSQPLTFMTK